MVSQPGGLVQHGAEHVPQPALAAMGGQDGDLGHTGGGTRAPPGTVISKA